VVLQRASDAYVHKAKMYVDPADRLLVDLREQLPPVLHDCANVADALGDRAVRKLERTKQTVAGVRAATIALKDLLTPPKESGEKRRAHLPLDGKVLTVAALRQRDADSRAAKKIKLGGGKGKENGRAQKRAAKPAAGAAAKGNGAAKGAAKGGAGKATRGGRAKL
jgi:hypothetical protein